MAHDADAEQDKDQDSDQTLASDDPRRSTARDVLRAVIALRRRESPEQTPDLLEVFDKQLAFIRRQYPLAQPSTGGQEQLDELARVRLKYLKRQLTLQTAERAAAIVCRVLQSAGLVAAVALAGRALGAW